MALEFAEKLSRLKVYPAADGYALRPEVALLASNETPYPPLPAVREAVARGAERRQPLPGPVEHRAAQGAERPLRRPRQPHRDRQRLLRHPARRRATRCSSRAPSSSTRGRRSASTRTWRRRRARARSRCRSTTRHEHDLDAMLAEITVATRLVIVCNPNNPTSTALPLDEIAAFVERRPAPRRA